MHSRMDGWAHHKGPEPSCAASTSTSHWPLRARTLHLLQPHPACAPPPPFPVPHLHTCRSTATCRARRTSSRRSRPSTGSSGPARACWTWAARPARGCRWRARSWGLARGAASCWASTYRQGQGRPAHADASAAGRWQVAGVPWNLRQRLELQDQQGSCPYGACAPPATPPACQQQRKGRAPTATPTLIGLRLPA